MDLGSENVKRTEIVAAIIIHNEKILCMQRGTGKHPYLSYKYEFPGGKVEPGETRPEALMRELKEEMDLDVFIDEKQFFMTVEHDYPDFSIVMHSYVCPVMNSQFTRKEHVNHCWSSIEDLREHDWAPADIPIVERIVQGGLTDE
jgi:8-oxo-dGTP diphosphatase